VKLTGIFISGLPVAQLVNAEIEAWRAKTDQAASLREVSGNTFQALLLSIGSLKSVCVGMAHPIVRHVQRRHRSPARFPSPAVVTSGREDRYV